MFWLSVRFSQLENCEQTANWSCLCMGQLRKGSDMRKGPHKVCRECYVWVADDLCVTWHQCTTCR
jgi:hypothetical protein